MKTSLANDHTPRCHRPDVVMGNRPGWRQVVRLAGLFLFLMTAGTGICGNPPTLTEYQIKALCLLNFAKYVDWPGDAFADTNSPITIGVIGENRFGDHLNQIMKAKRIGGREIVIQEIASEADWARCRILFISASETSHLPQILGRIKNTPTLTVGETEEFTQQGGVINFMKKAGKVHFEIDLDAAHQARLQVSSQLSRLADKVIGKP